MFKEYPIEKWRKKPIIVEVVKFDGTDECARFLQQGWGAGVVWRTWYNDDKFRIKTLEGEMILSEGDYVVKGAKDEFYPVKPDIFPKTFDDGIPWWRRLFLRLGGW